MPSASQMPIDLEPNSRVMRTQSTKWSMVAWRTSANGLQMLPNLYCWPRKVFGCTVPMRRPLLRRVVADRLVAAVVGLVPVHVAGHDRADAQHALDLGAVVDLLPDGARGARLAEDAVARARVADGPRGQLDHQVLDGCLDALDVHAAAGEGICQNFVLSFPVFHVLTSSLSAYCQDGAPQFALLLYRP